MRGGIAWGVVALCTIACGAAAPARGREVESESESVSVSVSESVSAASPVCVVGVASGHAPDLLVETNPVAHPSYDFDGYGPLHVFRIDTSGHATDLGLGSSPRMLDDTTFAYLDATYGPPPSSFFVRVARDGTVTRAAGGNGHAPGLGGPMPWHRGPFTADGCLSMSLENDCEGGGACNAEIYDVYRHGDSHPPIDSVPIVVDGMPSSLAMSEDGRRLAVVTRRSVLMIDRQTREQRTIPVDDFVVHFTADLHAMVYALLGEAPGIRYVDVASGQARDVPTTVSGGVALDACGESAVVFGRVDESTSRIERVFFDGTAPVTLFEGATGSRFMSDIHVDARGWVLVLGEGDDGPERGASIAWIVPLAGGAITAVPIDTGALVFDVVLGPVSGAP